MIVLKVGEQEYDAIQAALAYFTGIPYARCHEIASKSTGACLTVNNVSRLRIELERQHVQDQRNDKALAHAAAVSDDSGIHTPAGRMLRGWRDTPDPSNVSALNASNDEGEPVEGDSREYLGG
jgi:hypothetical protein